ncbi:ATP-dependent RNA helicase, putative [Trypanosoma brucei gambiense DAL972]|uniref:Pre-mRNA splicing factor, putative n=2 Tax=Trypanosoma brucei TaxID=5691 RepID=D0A778_TRYB9|nr:ATP-dependent RNA helicase, putative [Trypanosoma brucei gambiense DAL972]RHW67182.1 pre-mRNA-splicing factor ATP-dependent RNA helicase [Trypanosoma brucei equiperdum]CBH17529.1 ATP-dependent RNA helicase, putative [Trypanosoma brucei gambiense DAL972]|eukprot:XP_011779793.1 ATP-dependent RNA helicase, putative [Trypanosoma brucei gambiense DAL972]
MLDRRRPRDENVTPSDNPAFKGLLSMKALTTSIETGGSAGDDTEGRMTGNENAEFAYGSGFYLQEEYLERLRRRGHRLNNTETDNFGDDADNNDRSELSGSRRDRTQRGEASDVELIMDHNLQPRFFRLGNDFPAVSASSVLDGEGTNESMLPLNVITAHDTAGDIIIPVVSSSCRMAQQAQKGSTSLAALKRQQESERATREAMDTSKSQLTRLLQKGEFGQEVEVVDQSHKPKGLDSWLLDSTRDTEEDLEGEEEMLRRKVRRERMRLENSLNPSSANGAMTAETAAKEEERDVRERNYLDVQRRRQEKLDRVRDAKEKWERSTNDAEVSGARRIAILTIQRQLPIYRCKEELLRCIGENPVSIVVGETGSGKTTQLVQYLYQRGYTRGGGIIGCTQPRRLAAIGVARRVAEEMGCALGTRVGYAIHLDDNTSEDTEVKFMTDGVLLREIVRDPNVDKYSVIVLDEAHERSVNTDVLLGVLQAAVRRRSDLKLVVTSATMDILKFSKFFGNAPCYEIPGQSYEVDVQYATAPIEDYVSEAVFRVCQLHIQMPLEGKHDILVFMTGRDDVLGVCSLILRRLQEMDPKWLDSLLLLPCLSEAVGATATGVLDPTPSGMRKCVVATNVAETSLTIDGIRYVVDCGFMKTNVFRPKLGMNTLQRYPISQAQANQRKGRAGRTAEGICYRLYTESQFKHEMLLSSVPEIQRSSIDSVVLLLKSIGVSRLIDFDFMDPPPAANIRRSMWQLWVLGLLDDNGNITADGKCALEFPLAPTLAKVLLESTVRECSVEAVRVVSVISADPKGLFELPKGSEEAARQHHSRFHVNDSDHLALLNVLTHFIENGKSRQWARDHFLHLPTLLRACEVQQQLLERLRQLKRPIVSCGAKGLDRVRQCVASGFCLLSARRSSTNWSAYRPMLNAGVTCYVHPSSAVYARAEMPLYVVYHDLLLTTREYLVIVTAVEPEWLVEASRGVFIVKGSPKGLVTSAATPSGTAVVENRSVTGRVVSETLQNPSPIPQGLSVPRPPVHQPKSKGGMVLTRRRNNI